MIHVDLSDLQLACDFVSGDVVVDTEAYVCLQTGRVYLSSSEFDMDPEGDALPPDLGNPDRYVGVPGKRDLGLGRDLALRFAEERVPERYERTWEIFRSPGAFRRFKDMLEREDILDQWYAFEEQAVIDALSEWCDENGLVLSRTPRTE